MTTSELMTIGAFARATGLTAGALRFYADSSLLLPARIDDYTGYRYYAHDQVEQATTIRRLREFEMPLDKIALVLAGDLSHIDRHVTNLIAQAQRARRSAAQVRGAFHTEKEPIMIAVNGPVFADAVEQILTATAHHPEHPVLGGVCVEASDDSLTLTATDRFRLSTRTVVVAQSNPSPWTAVVDGDDLRAAMPEVRQRHRVEVNVDNSGLVFLPGDRHCRTMAEEFPDYRTMLDSLPAVTTRVVVSKNAVQKSIEDQMGEHLVLRAERGHVQIKSLASAEPVEIPASVTGPNVEIAFAMTTLYPAISSAVGPEIMIDISDPHMPVVVRSADNGDLTTLAMPVDPKGLD